jgi:membrane protease YdiL (CAAX protease family)
MTAAFGHTCRVTEVAESEAEERPKARGYLGLETLAVLGVSYGMSGISALMTFVRNEVQTHGHLAHGAPAVAVAGPSTTYPLLDLADDLVDVLAGLAPAFLAIVLLMRTPAGVGLGIGLDRLRSRDVVRGLGFSALIGIPGLGLVWMAYQLGFNTQLAIVDLPDVWYRVPLLLMNAAQDGIAEEIVVCAFVLTRLRQLGWSDGRALGTAAVLRGSYHLYQGLGGFFGNMVMGLIFGWWFQRTRRVVPLVIAHFVIDAVSFIGVVYLHDHIRWI